LIVKKALTYVIMPQSYWLDFLLSVQESRFSYSQAVQCYRMKDHLPDLSINTLAPRVDFIVSVISLSPPIPGNILTEALFCVVIPLTY